MINIKSNRHLSKSKLSSLVEAIDNRDNGVRRISKSCGVDYLLEIALNAFNDDEMR